MSVLVRNPGVDARNNRGQIPLVSLCEKLDPGVPEDLGREDDILDLPHAKHDGLAFPAWYPANVFATFVPIG